MENAGSQRLLDRDVGIVLEWYPVKKSENTLKFGLQHTLSTHKELRGGVLKLQI